MLPILPYRPLCSALAKTCRRRQALRPELERRKGVAVLLVQWFVGYEVIAASGKLLHERGQREGGRGRGGRQWKVFSAFEEID